MIAKTNHLGALTAAVGALVAVGLLLLIMVVVRRVLRGLPFPANPAR